MFACTFAAGVVRWVQYLVFCAGTAPASWYGQAQTAAATVVHTTRIRACELKRHEWDANGSNFQILNSKSMKYLAAAERHTCGSQRSVAAHCAAGWPCWWWCPVCKWCRCGTRSRTRTVYSGTDQRRGWALDLHTPSVVERKGDRLWNYILRETIDCMQSPTSRSSAQILYCSNSPWKNNTVCFRPVNIWNSFFATNPSQDFARIHCFQGQLHAFQMNLSF